MASNRNTVLRAIGLLSLVVAGASAQAADPQALDRIEVTGAARHDVLSACPALQLDLQEGMEKTISQHQITGSYLVQFSLTGKKVDSLHTPWMPIEYRQRLRSSVRGTDCQDAAATKQPQRFAFIVDIKTNRQDGGTRSAGLSMRPALGTAQP